MDWKDISTAPKDGTPFQAYVKIVHESEADKFEWYPRLRINDGVFEHLHSHGWFDINMLRWIKRTPTHWMPLPDPPKETP